MPPPPPPSLLRKELLLTNLNIYHSSHLTAEAHTATAEGESASYRVKAEGFGGQAEPKGTKRALLPFARAANISSRNFARLPAGLLIQISSLVLNSIGLLIFRPNLRFVALGDFLWRQRMSAAAAPLLPVGDEQASPADSDPNLLVVVVVVVDG